MCDCVKNPKHIAMSRIVCGDRSPVNKIGACFEGFAGAGMVYQSNHWMEDRSGGHDVSSSENRLSSEYCVQPQVEQDRVFLPLGYEPRV